LSEPDLPVNWEAREDVQPLACRVCGNKVLVQKHTLAHTSVQWTEDIHCMEFAKAPDLTSRALTPTCLAMRDSIEEAVRTGRIHVPEE
jgi:hypothetical protein